MTKFWANQTYRFEQDSPFLLYFSAVPSFLILSRFKIP